MENQNQKSKIYIIIFIVMILFAIVLTVTKKANAPVVVPIQDNHDIGILGNGGDLVFLSILPNA